MHVLFLTDNFPPETNAPASRVFEHARHWVRRGARVTVITGAPNFPQGRLHSGYRNAWYARESVEGIDVVRVKTYIAANSGFARRVLDYLSFMVTSFIAGMLQRRPDVIVATSPQFFTAVAGCALAWLRRIPWVFELRDLWPASIHAVGALPAGRVLRALERLELFLYQRADKVIAVTEAFRANLIERGIPAAKIEVVLNGVDLECYQPGPKPRQLTLDWGLQERLVIGYFGTHGLAHDLENVIAAAKLLRDNEELCFLFVGDGAARRKIMSEAAAANLTNVHFEEAQPKERMPDIWRLCDLALVHLADEELFRTVIPSKIFEAMGMAKGILFVGPEGEGTKIVRSTGAGLCIPPGDPQALALAVRGVHDDKQLAVNLGLAGVQAAPQYARARQAERMLAQLAELAGWAPEPAHAHDPAEQIPEEQAWWGTEGLQPDSLSKHVASSSRASDVANEELLSR